MSAILIDGPSLHQAESRFAEIMSTLSGRFPEYISPEQEFHASDIYNGKGTWRKVFSGNRQRYDLLHRLTESLSALDFWIVIQGIDLKKSTKNQGLPQEPRSVSFELLIDEINFWLVDLELFSVLICDAGVSHHQIELMRDAVMARKRFSVHGLESPVTGGILDSVHFGNSQRSRGIQIADLIAFTRHRLELQRAHLVKPDPFIEEIWNSVSWKVLVNRTWVP